MSNEMFATHKEITTQTEAWKEALEKTLATINTRCKKL